MWYDAGMKKMVDIAWAIAIGLAFIVMAPIWLMQSIQAWRNVKK